MGFGFNASKKGDLRHVTGCLRFAMIYCVFTRCNCRHNCRRNRSRRHLLSRIIA